jgi:3-phenylpropionate/cinnamic acid dioxygenase small subunit
MNTIAGSWGYEAGMTTDDLQSLGPADLQYDLDALTAAYVHALDDGAFERWPDFFTEDCVYKIIPRENYENELPLAIWYCEGQGMLRDRVTAIRETQLYAPRAMRHITGNARVQTCVRNVLHAVTNYAVYESTLDRTSEVFSVGRYIDRIVAEDGRLRFAEKLCVFDTSLVPTSLIYPL